MSLKDKTAKGIVWDMGGTVARQGSGFIVSIVLARLLEPSEFGLVGMAMAFITISQVFIDVGFSSALIQNKENSSVTYSSVFYVNVLAGLLLTLLFYFGAPLIGSFYKNEAVTHLVEWLSLLFLVNSFNQVQTAIQNRNLNFRILSIQTVVASVMGGIAGIICALYDMGVYSLVVQQLTTAGVSTLVLWSTVSWRPELRFSIVEVKKLTGFSAFVFFDQFVSSIFQKLDVILIGKIFTSSILGYYTRSLQLKDLVITYSSTSISKVFYPVLATLKDNQQEFSRIYFKVISVVAFLGYAITGLLFIWGRDIIIGLFGQKWLPSVEMFEVLILGVCNYPINAMMINAFMSKGRSKENFLIGLLRKLFRVIPLVIGYFYGIMSFIYAQVSLSYFLTVLNVLLLARLSELDMRKHFLKIFEGVIPLAALVIVFYTWTFDTILLKFLLTVGFMSVFVLFNYLMKSEGVHFIKDNALILFNRYKHLVFK
jgi:O-antigen/teichoic acid export membrane protein